MTRLFPSQPDPIAMDLQPNLGLLVGAGSAASFPASLFASSEQGAVYIAHPDYCFQERTGASATTTANPGDPVGSMQDQSGNDHWMMAPTDAARPTLRQDATGAYYLACTATTAMFAATATEIPLGTEWAHIGGWKGGESQDILACYLFATSASSNHGIYHNVSSDQLRYGTSSRIIDAGNQRETFLPFILTIEFDLTSLDARWQTKASAVISESLASPADPSSNDPGLALFTRDSDGPQTQEWQGRFYGGIWIDRALTTQERSDGEDWAMDLVYKPSDPLNKFDASQAGFIYDIHPAYLYQERTGASATTRANVGDPVGSIQDRSGSNNWLTASADLERATLRQDGVTGAYYLEGAPDDHYDFTDTSLLQNVGAFLFSAGLDQDATAAAKNIFVATDNASDERAAVRFTASEELELAGSRLDADTVDTTTAASASATGQALIVTAEFDWTNSDKTGWIDRSSVISETAFQTDGSTSNTASSSITVLSDGTDDFSGDCYAMFGIVDDMSAAERDDIEDWIASQSGYATTDVDGNITFDSNGEVITSV